MYKQLNLNMFKYLLIINLFIMMVATQDMPPPDLDISTIPPLTTTPEPTTTEPVTATTEAILTTTEEETSFTTTTETLTTTTAAATTSTTPATTTSTERNDVPIAPVTDSPFPPPTQTTAAAPHYPFNPSYPIDSGMRCYFRKQYGHAELRWTCQGLRYFYPIECFECCLLPYANFAGCYRVQGHHCNSLDHRHNYYK